MISFVLLHYMNLYWRLGYQICIKIKVHFTQNCNCNSITIETNGRQKYSKLSQKSIVIFKSEIFSKKIFENHSMKKNHSGESQ